MAQETPLMLEFNHKGVDSLKVMRYIWDEIGANSFQFSKSVNPSKTLITMKNVTLLNKVLDLKQIEIDNINVSFRKIDHKETVVYVKYVPYELSHEHIRLALKPYGKINSLCYEYYTGKFKDVSTGTRIVKMEMNNPVPNLMRIAGFRAVCVYDGVKIVCWKCKREGHIAAHCDYYDKCRCKKNQSDWANNCKFCNAKRNLEAEEIFNCSKDEPASC